MYLQWKKCTSLFVPVLEKLMKTQVNFVMQKKSRQILEDLG